MTSTATNSLSADKLSGQSTVSHSVQNTKSALIKRLSQLSKAGIFSRSGELNQSDRAVLQFLYLRVAVNTTQDIERGHVLPEALDPARISEATGLGVREVRLSIARLDGAGLIKVSWRVTPIGRAKSADIVIDLDDLEVRPVGKASGKVDVENLQIETLEWIITLTERGEFERHQAARTVLTYYGFNIVANDNERLGRQGGDVMEMCVSPAVVARKTGLDEQTVRRANDWLHEQGFIWAGDQTGEKYRYVANIAIMSIDEASERKRKRKLQAGTLTRKLNAKTDLVPDRTDLMPDETDLMPVIDNQLLQPANTSSAPDGAGLQEKDLGKLDGYSARPISAQPAENRPEASSSQPVDDEQEIDNTLWSVSSRPADSRPQSLQPDQHRPAGEIWKELLREVAEEHIRQINSDMPVHQMMKLIGSGATFRQRLDRCRQYMDDLDMPSDLLDELRSSLDAKRRSA